MDPTALVVLAFTIFRPLDDLAFEQGEVTARTCQIAEGHVRDGLQPGQELLVHGCAPKAAPSQHLSAHGDR